MKGDDQLACARVVPCALFSPPILASSSPLGAPKAAPGLPGPCDHPLTSMLLLAQEQMTAYVVTRWYRAPEILLLARRYSKARSWEVMGDIVRCETLHVKRHGDGEGDARPGDFCQVFNRNLCDFVILWFSGCCDIILKS